jgi:hypothetical protein
MFTPTDDSGELKFAPYEVTQKFHDFALDEHIIKNIDKKGYEKPTEIQEKTLQAIMDGKDMLGLANTGSGKTAAFLIPILHRMLSGVQSRLLIMTPTRELADQIQTEFRWIAQGTFLRSVVVVGGASARGQIMDIKRGVHCIVATPGRLKDLYDRGVIDFSDYGHVVLDGEVDDGVDPGEVEHPGLGLHHRHRQVAARGHEIDVIGEQSAIGRIAESLGVDGGTEGDTSVVGEWAKRNRLGAADHGDHRRDNHQ